MTGVLQYAAFTDQPGGGNPAGVVLDATALDAAAMQQIAAELGHSESAFVCGPVTEDGPVPLRYFSPEGEIPFCGHATIATAAALAEHDRPGTYRLATGAGEVRVRAIAPGSDGNTAGEFDSPSIGYAALPEDLAAELVAALGWRASDLHPAYAPGIGTAGNHHPVLVARELARLARLDYDFARLQRLCRAHDWITVQLVTPTGEGRWRSRNPFPYGGVVEDPATGSAAAGLAGYLRHLGQFPERRTMVIDQGVEMGRPSRINVTGLADRARIGGRALPIADPGDPGPRP